jgi:hypothetical protein
MDAKDLTQLAAILTAGAVGAASANQPDVKCDAQMWQIIFLAMAAKADELAKPKAAVKAKRGKSED